MSKQKHESCDGCRYDLGAGRDNCTLCVAAECRDGGGFEAWKAKDPANIQAVGRMITAAMNMSAAKAKAFRTRDELLTEIEIIASQEFREKIFDLVNAERHKYGLEAEAMLLYEAKKWLLQGREPDDVFEFIQAKVTMLELELLCIL